MKDLGCTNTTYNFGCIVDNNVHEHIQQNQHSVSNEIVRCRKFLKPFPFTSLCVADPESKPKVSAEMTCLSPNEQDDTEQGVAIGAMYVKPEKISMSVDDPARNTKETFMAEKG